MYRPYRGGQPSARQFKFQQDSPDQHGAGRMEQQIDGVIAGGVHSPQSPFDPPCRAGEGEIIRRFGCEPELPEAIGSANQPVLRDQAKIIPQEPGTENRGKGENNDRYQCGGCDGLGISKSGTG
jgi:hypothetical protein